MANNGGGFTVWLTGMLGTGKTTTANYIAARLRQVGRSVEVIDEEEIGEELWKELGDSKQERQVITRRLGVLADMLTRNEVCTLVAAVSPYKGAREENRRRIGRYVEVYLDCPTDELIKRDTTGRYKKALSGEIPNFIGVTEPYEPPNSPEVTITSNVEAVEAGALKVFQALLDLSYMSAEELKVITGTRMKAQKIVKSARRSAKGARARPAARAARVAAPKKKAAGKRGKR